MEEEPLYTGLDYCNASRMPPDALIFSRARLEVPTELLSDLKEAQTHQLEIPESQFWRRMYVRCVCSFIEGSAHYIKTFTADLYEFSIMPMLEGYKMAQLHCPIDVCRDGINRVELSALRDEAPIVKENGDCEVRASFASSNANIRFMFKMAKKVFKLSFDPDYSVSGWDNLKQAVLIRHRVTHPKSDEGMDVAEAELPKIRDAAQWFADTCGDCMSAISQAMEKAVQQHAEMAANFPPELTAYLAMREQLLSPK